MSSPNPDEEDAERLFSLPPQTPSINFFIDPPSLLPDDLLGGYTDDFSLFFGDDTYIQNIPSPAAYPSVQVVAENTSTSYVAHQPFQQSQYQPIEEANQPFQQSQYHQPIDQGGAAQVQGISSWEGGSQAGPSSASTMAATKETALGMEMQMKQKKMDHNAKERIRRRHLNASYVTLRSLLPDTHKPKEKWSEAYIIERTVEHIPEVEAEIEKLKSNKDEMRGQVERNALSVSVSTNEVRRGEVIIQVCHLTRNNVLSEILYRLESESIAVMDASVFRPSPDTSCYHFRIQMDESSIGEGYVQELNHKFVSWFAYSSNVVVA